MRPSPEFDGSVFRVYLDEMEQLAVGKSLGIHPRIHRWSVPTAHERSKRVFRRTLFLGISALWARESMGIGIIAGRNHQHPCNCDTKTGIRGHSDRWTDSQPRRLLTSASLSTISGQTAHPDYCSKVAGSPPNSQRFSEETSLDVSPTDTNYAKLRHYSNVL